MTVLCVFFFFVGCIAGGALASWWHRRPSKFDQWRERMRKEVGDEYPERD